MVKIDSVFVGAATSGRPLGDGKFYATDKELFRPQRDTMAARAKAARAAGQRDRIYLVPR